MADDEELVGLGEGVFHAVGGIIRNDANIDPAAAEFAEDYREAFGVDPGTYSTEAFDATNAIIAALKGLGEMPTRESVLQAVKEIDYVGLSKRIQCDSDGEVLGRTVFIYQVEDGKRVSLGTTAELVK